jgi:hypothetical protein
MLRRLMIDRTTVSAIAAEFGVSWHTVSAIAMRATADLIAAAGPDRLTGVRVIGVDEHRWAPRRVGQAGFVTLIIDLTPTHDQTGPVRLLDLLDGRSATALASWLAAQPAPSPRPWKSLRWTGSPTTRPPPPRVRLSWVVHVGRRPGRGRGEGEHRYLDASHDGSGRRGGRDRSRRGRHAGCVESRWRFGTCSGSARNIRAGPCYIPSGSDCGGGPATSGVSGPGWVH